VLPLDASVLKQHVLPLDMCLFYDSLELVSSTAVCAFPGCVCVSALQCSSLYCPQRCVACSCMLMLQMHVFVQQQPMLYQEVYGLQQHVLHLYCLSARACAAPGRVFLVFSRTFVLHLACLSTRALRCTWMCLPIGALCCTWTCQSARIFAAPVRVCLQELCDAPGCVCRQECSPGCNCRCSVENLFGLFRFVSKQFCLFRLF
jgi:hypothetical protein